MLTDNQKLETGIIYENEGLLAAVKHVRYLTGINPIGLAANYTLNVLKDVGCDVEKYESKFTRLHI